MRQPKWTILIVDDEQPTIDSLELLLGDTFRLQVARNGEEALEKVRKDPVDLVFLDIGLPGMDGFEVLREMKVIDAAMDVVMLTADEKAKTAMKALELGAYHYITKPYDNDEILLITQRVFERKNLTAEILSLRDEVQQDTFYDIVGQDPKMKEIFQLVKKLAPADSSVLLTGESGTGKELIARAVHLHSLRKHKPFKAINCGAIPENLLESELFGHEKGAFTGAHERKIGKVEMANGGTLFLDEISAMPETLQVKLLRVLQECEIERVGGTRSIPIDVRVIAATNSNMNRLIESGSFREDLFYRINVIHIHLPPLRERKTDIPLVANHFLKHFSKKFHKPVSGFTESALQTLKDYAWPGNVRELRNVIERAVVLSDSESIESSFLPLDLSIPHDDLADVSDPLSLKEILDAYEKRVILNILERVRWNQTKAAEVLGIHRNTLLGKLESHAINCKALKQDSGSRILV